MRIVVNDIAASSGGAMSVLRDLYNFIKENDKENEWIFLLGDHYLEETERIMVHIMKKVKKNWINKLKFDLFTGKKYIKSLNPDVVFSMQNIITFGLDIPQIVYIHQSIPFQKVKRFSFFKSSERRLAVYQHVIGRIIVESARRADKVIVQTDWMKRALCCRANIKEEKVFHIYPSIGDFSIYRRNEAFNKNSFFYPTSKDVYKNNHCIYEAAAILIKRGIQGFNVTMTTLSEGNFPAVTYIGRIPRDRVIAEYNKGTLIFPSYIESFPLPLEEARQLGTLVLASDCEFSREILDGYKNAYFFNPFKPEELATLMAHIITGVIVKKPVSDDKFRGTDAEQSRGWEPLVKIITGAKSQDQQRFSHELIKG